MKMEEWKECKFKDLYRIPSKNGLSKPSRIRGSGYKMINMGELFSNDRIYNIPMELVPLTDTEKENAKVEVNDLLFARQSLIVEGAGKCSIVMETDELTVFESHIIRVRLNPELAYPPFFYYYFKNKNSPIRAIIQHCVQAGIKASDLAEITVKLPPLPTQQKIAAILSSLDDKIELNNKINTNLEQQAGALFKNWFVDFEPFGGKMPEGWKVGKLSEIADYLNGLAMQKFRPLEGEEGLPVLKIKELRQGCCDESSELCSPSKVKPEYIIHDGDVIFSWSGSLLVDIWCGGTCGLNQHLFKVTSQTYEKWFYYLWTKHHLDRFIFLAADKATTMGHIKREELDKAEVIIPDDKTYSKLTMTLSPIIDTIINNRVENRRLSEIRDNLLPELMSGNINVEDITI